MVLLQASYGAFTQWRWRSETQHGRRCKPEEGVHSTTFLQRHRSWTGKGWHVSHTHAHTHTHMLVKPALSPIEAIPTSSHSIPIYVNQKDINIINNIQTRYLMGSSGAWKTKSLVCTSVLVYRMWFESTWWRLMTAYRRLWFKFHILLASIKHRLLFQINREIFRSWHIE